MKKITLVVMLFPAYAAMAQMGMHSRMKGDSSFTIGVYRNIGVSFLEFENLNNRIKSSPQYKQLPDVIATIGLGSVAHKGHLVGVNGVTLGYGMNGNKKKKNSTLAFIGISGDVGYDFFKMQSRFQLYPTLGLGLEWYRARFNKDISNVAFDNVLNSNTEQNNVRSVTFYNFFFNYRGGLNLVAQSKDGSGTFGLQGGYTGSFTDVSWKTNYSQSLKNSPSDELDRFFINLFVAKSLNFGHHNHATQM